MLVCRRCATRTPRRTQLFLLFRVLGSRLRNYSQKATGGGPSGESLQVIRFQISRSDAEAAYNRYHSTGLLSAVPLGRVHKVEAKFLPFWYGNAKIRATIRSAQVGYDYLASEYNPRTRKMEMRWKTKWRWAQCGETSVNTFSAMRHVGLQVYASYNYRRSHVDALRLPTKGLNLEPFTPEALSTPDPGTLPLVEPFTMKPRIALLFCEAHIQQEETRAAEAYLLRTHRADRTRLVDVAIQFLDLTMSPVFVPAYVLTSQHLGRDLRTFVHGADSTAVGGQRVLNSLKTVLYAAAASATAMTLYGGLAGHGVVGTFWLGVVLPSFVAGVLALYWPLISLRLIDLWRSWEIHAHKKYDEQSTWDEDFVAGYQAQEEERRREEWRESQQYGKWNGEGGTGWERADRRNVGRERRPEEDYYKVLGVGRNATKQDIQAVFRTLAMKHHPDRVSDEKEKEAAKVQFQKISAAYAVLRDPAKRRKYDASL